MNGEKLVVPANGTRNVGSLFPIVLKFDRGNSTVSTKEFNFSGTVQIGVSATDNLWNFFRPKAESASRPRISCSRNSRRLAQTSASS